MSRAKRRERSQSRIVPYQLNYDEYGPFIVYCKNHKGPVSCERFKRECLGEECEKYEIFRPESRRYKT